MLPASVLYHTQRSMSTPILRLLQILFVFRPQIWYNVGMATTRKPNKRIWNKNAVKCANAKNLAVVPPAHYIKMLLKAYEATPEELAARWEVDPAELVCMINAEAPVTAVVADKLSVALGMSAGALIRLQERYDRRALSPQQLTL